MKTKTETSSGARSDNVRDTLSRVRELLAAGAADQALALLPHGAGDKLLRNARGVCLMRLGRIRDAVELFRGLTLRDATADLDRAQPAAFARNFATALLMDRNLRGCRDLLSELGQAGEPVAGRLREALAAHRRALGLWGRIQFSVYGLLERPVDLGFPPGELLFPGEELKQPG